MSILLDSLSSQLLRGDKAAWSAYPAVVSAWIKPSNNSTMKGVIFNGDAGSGVVYDAGQLRADVALGAGARCRSFNGAVGPNADSPNVVLLNFWQHLLLLFRAANDRGIVLAGGTEGTTSTSLAIGTRNRFSLGAMDDASPSNYFDGRIERVGVYTAAPDAVVLAALIAGASPLLHPEGLAHYFPLIGEVDDVVGDITLSEVGSPSWSSDSAPVIEPEGIARVTSIENFGPIRVYSIAWQSDVYGQAAIDFDDANPIVGVPQRLVRVPGSNRPPVANYDLTLASDIEPDLLGGAGGDGSDSAADGLWLRWDISDAHHRRRAMQARRYRLEITNAGPLRSGLVQLFTFDCREAAA